MAEGNGGDGDAGSRRRGRPVSAGERVLFRSAMRDATPLNPTFDSGRQPPVASPEPPVPEAGDRKAMSRPAGAAKPTEPPAAPVRQPRFVEPGAPGYRRAAPMAGIDRRTARRLRDGALPIDARIDLHGMTQAQAHAALNRFLRQCWNDGRRTVLVITGKGNRHRHEVDPWHDGGGILRARLPHWLQEHPNRDIVLLATSAQPRHGGDGAFYLRLRRRR